MEVYTVIYDSIFAASKAPQFWKINLQVYL